MMIFTRFSIKYPSSLLILILLLFVPNTNTKIPTIELSPLNHHIVLYPNSINKSSQTENPDLPQKLYFKTDFTSTQFILDKKYQHACLYLDNHPKTRTQNKCLTKFMKIRYEEVMVKSERVEVQQEDDQAEPTSLIHGIIGLKNNSEFSKAIKSSLEWKEAKFLFKIYENKIEVLNSACTNPRFPPYNVFLTTPHAHLQAPIQHFSLTFNPNPKQFAKLFNQTNNPFILTRQELASKIQIQIYQEIEHIPVRSLLGQMCLPVASTHNYQCDLTRKHQKEIMIGGKTYKTSLNDMGLILAEYEPILCTDIDALEFKNQNKLDSEFYYWGHLILIALQFFILVLYLNRNAWRYRLSSWFRRSDKYRRTH